MAKSLQVEDLTECPICQERFTQPKILSCQHTFCLNCLRGYVKDAPHFNCPTCRQRQKVPKAGLHVLKDSLVIKQLMDMTALMTASCPDCCEEGRLLKECDHCEEKLCAACRKKHMKLAEGILAQFLSTIGKVRPRMDAPAFEPTLEEERELRSSVLSEFDKVTNTLTERKAQLLAQVDGVMGFRRLLSMTREDARSHFQVKIKSYHNVGQLMSLKEFLTQLDSDRPFLKTLAKGSRPILELDASCLPSLGVLYCEDRAFSARDRPSVAAVDKLEPVQKIDGVSQTVADSSSVVNHRANHSLFPSNVDYECKRIISTRQIIDTHPNGRVFKPTCAVYCDRENAIYCISEGEILCYDFQTLNGRRIGDVTDAKQLTVMKSGEVLFTNGEAVRCVEKDMTGTRWSVRTIVGGFDNLTQLCCLGDNVLVLDAFGVHEHRCLTSFTEQGEYVRRYSISEKLEASSKICVGVDGCICVGGIGIFRRDNWDYEWSCWKPMSVQVNWGLDLVRLTPHWYGNSERLIMVDRGREDYYYRFFNRREYRPGYEYRRGYEYYYRTIRDDDSVPSDDRIICEKAIGGLCVDGNGYISVTKPDRNQIDVYIETSRYWRNYPLLSVPLQFISLLATWRKLISVLVSLLLLVSVNVLDEDAKDSPYFQKTQYALCVILICSSLFRVPFRHIVTIPCFNEPNSVSLTPDGKMIVCDNNGINIV